MAPALALATRWITTRTPALQEFWLVLSAESLLLLSTARFTWPVHPSKTIFQQDVRASKGS
jgi:hypothetical protein